MFKIVLLVCFISAAAVVAYDFKDSDFNEYLTQDLIDINAEIGGDELFAPRFKRETPAAAAPTTTTSGSSSSQESSVEKVDDDKKCKSKNKNHGFYKCCNDTDLAAVYEKVKDLKKTCLNEYRGAKSEEQATVDMFSCERVNKTKEEYVCITQCVGQKLNIVDAEGNLIEAALKEHVKNDLSFTEWQKAIAETVADKCLAEVKESLKKKELDTTAATTTATATTTEKPKCNSAALKFSHCVWREFTKGCPKNLQSDSSKCTKLREKLEKGEKIDFHHYHRFHHSKSDFEEQ